METGFVQGLMFFAVLLFSISLHESAHAWAAYQMGDDTAKRLGRISLNPMRHIDLLGTIVIPLVMFFTGAPLIGWAKPTPVNPRNFRQLAKGHVLVSAAGPASNLALAIGCLIILVLVIRVGVVGIGISPSIIAPLIMILDAAIFLNIVLMIFNLIPLPPLDGSWIVSWGLPRSISAPYKQFVEPYGPWILLALVVTGLLGRLLYPVYESMQYAISLIMQLLLQTPS